MDKLIDSLINKLNNTNEIRRCKLDIEKNFYILKVDDEYVNLDNNQKLNVLRTLSGRLNEVKDKLYLVEHETYMDLLMKIPRSSFKDDLIDTDVSVMNMYNFNDMIVTHRFMETAAFYRYRSVFLNSWWMYNKIYNSLHTKKLKWYDKLKFWK